LVSHVKQKGSWKGSADKLKEFWTDIGIKSRVEDDPFFTTRWERYHRIDPDCASVEEARRYYSARQFILSGADKVFSAPKLHLQYTYFDPSSLFNKWVQYDNSKLRQRIKENVVFPIGASFDKNPIPRLLALSVDIEEAEVVTFDSYTGKSEYGYNEETGEYQQVKYDQGLMVEHIMASASVPIHYDFELVPKNYDYTSSDEEREAELKEDLQRDNLKDHLRFWDGGISSNTPLRELIQAHQDYWWELKQKVPNLEVYVVDVWPWMKTCTYPIRSDYDSVKNRQNELTYQDKTEYEERVANMVSDYYNLAKLLIDLAKKKGATDTDIDAILDEPVKYSTHRTGKAYGKKRQYGNLLDKRFEISKLIRIERSGDKDDISNKRCDFSSDTISTLFKQGIDDALNTLVKDVKKGKDKEDEGIQAAYDQIKAFINEIKKQNVEDQNANLIRAAENIKDKLK
jgi:NTE family protein